MNVKCENTNCKHEFEPIIYEKYLGAMITETYFKCPKCGKKYIVTLNNCKTRKLEKNIENIKNMLNNKLPVFVKNCFKIALKDNITIHKQVMKKLMKGEYSWRYQAR